MFNVAKYSLNGVSKIKMISVIFFNQNNDKIIDKL